MDALLDDPVFFAPFVPFFDPRLGRPSTPMEVYLRLMFLKFRYRLGYETPRWAARPRRSCTVADTPGSVAADGLGLRLIRDGSGFLPRLAGVQIAPVAGVGSGEAGEPAEGMQSGPAGMTSVDGGVESVRGPVVEVTSYRLVAQILTVIDDGVQIVWMSAPLGPSLRNLRSMSPSDTVASRATG